MTPGHDPRASDPGTGEHTGEPRAVDEAGAGPVDSWWDDAHDAHDERATAHPARGRRNVVLAGISAVAIAAASYAGFHVASSAGSTTGTGAAAALNGPGANGPGPNGPGAGGGAATITAIDGAGITVRTASGTTRTVKTGASTVVTTETASTASAIRTGDHVLVIGNGSSTSVAAQRVVDIGATTAATGGGAGAGPPGGPGGGTDRPPRGAQPGGGSGTPPQGAGNGASAPGAPGAPGPAGATTAGTVTSVSGSALTITTSDGSTVRVAISSATVVLRRATALLSALRVGDRVQLMAAPTSSTVDAIDVVPSGS